jgi:hypothetical protein
MCERLVFYQTVLSDTPEIREIRSLKPRLDRGEVRPLSFSTECQSLWLYLPINKHEPLLQCQRLGTLLDPCQSGDADGDSHFCSRCEACISTWYLMPSLLRMVA